ncbi:hypothetical protein RFI_32583, partial [Reticulomyxa filosa]
KRNRFSKQDFLNENKIGWDDLILLKLYKNYWRKIEKQGHNKNLKHIVNLHHPVCLVFSRLENFEIDMVKYINHIAAKPVKEMKKKSMSYSINCHNTEENMCSLILIVTWRRQEHIKYACNHKSFVRFHGQRTCKSSQFPITNITAIFVIIGFIGFRLYLLFFFFVFLLLALVRILDSKKILLEIFFKDISENENIKIDSI